MVASAWRLCFRDIASLASFQPPGFGRSCILGCGLPGLKNETGGTPAPLGFGRSFVGVCGIPPIRPPRRKTANGWGTQHGCSPAPFLYLGLWSPRSQTRPGGTRHRWVLDVPLLESVVSHPFVRRGGKLRMDGARSMAARPLRSCIWGCGLPGLNEPGTPGTAGFWTFLCWSLWSPTHSSAAADEWVGHGAWLLDRYVPVLGFVVSPVSRTRPGVPAWGAKRRSICLLIVRPEF